MIKNDITRTRVATFSSILLSTGLLAQTPGTGAISGTVLDPSDRVLARAEILAESEATHLARTITTSADGGFRLPLLPAGRYTVTVHAPGFADSATHSVEVTVSQTTPLQVRLAIAEATVTVRVEARPAVVDADTSALGGLVDQTAVETLPLSSRNYTQILGLSPGVIVDLPDARTLGNGTQNVASDGATPTSNNIQFNGVDANNLIQNSAATAETSQVGTPIPAPDAIQEFRVQTANYDAVYGRGSGANVDLLSKSGTNHFHGSAWEFVRNNLFNANEFFSKLDGQPRADLKQNQFGGTFGGPILHDKTFAFVAYQGTTEVNGLGDEQHPILPLLTADRSAATLGRQFCPAQHFDNAGNPATGYLTSAGGTQVACDGSNINPVTVAILNAKLPNGQFAVPSPQVSLAVSGPDASDQFPVGESTYAIPAHYREDQFSINLDHVISANDTLAERFFWARATTVQPFSPNAANVPGWGTNELNRNTLFVLSDTHVFNPRLVNIARFGYTRFDGLAAVQNPLTAQAIGEGVPTGLVSATSNLPGLSVGGLTIGDAGTPSQFQVTNTFLWQDILAYTKGRNNTRFGLELKRSEVDENNPIVSDGLLQISTFDDFLLGQSAAQNGSPFGLSNVSTSIAGGGIFRRNERYTDFAGFAENDLKVTPRLTLNLGVRYEIFGAPVETNGRLANFNPALAPTGPVPVVGTYAGFSLPSNFAGAIPAGFLKTSFPGLYKTPLGDVSPRFGFAYQVLDHPALVLRGGFGIYYDRHSGNLPEQTASQPPFATLQILGGAPNGPATLRDPFVPPLLPSSSYPVFMPRTPTSFPFIEALNPNLQDGLSKEYNLNVQYAPGRGYLLQVGYVGTASRHRPGQVEFDQATLAGPDDPVNGETFNSIQNVSARLPIQGVSQGSLLTDSVFVANYNALQASLTQRLQHGFQLGVAYTWSKNLDEVNGEVGTDVFELQLPTNNQNDLHDSSYGLAGDDRDQRLVLNFVWLTPKLASVPRLPRYLLTHWQFSGISVFQAGIPLSVFDGNAGSVYGLLGGEVRAQRTGRNPSTGGSLYSRALNGYLDPSAFTRAPEAPNGTSLADQDFGNSGVGLVRGPGQHNLDAAVERLFPVTETSSLRFRAEFFNLTNTPQFSNPNTSLGYTDPTLLNPVASPTFGKITGTSSNPRIIQLAARFTF